MMMKVRTVLVLAFLGLIVSCNRTHTFPYQDVKLDFETRVDDLVSRMTLEEKVSQLDYYADEVEYLGIPQYNW